MRGVQAPVSISVRTWFAISSSVANQTRPSIYHHKPIRAEGHLLISVIACQLVQVIRRRLRQTGRCASWTTLRRTLEGQQRITATFRQTDGRTLHVRKDGLTLKRFLP